MQDDWKEVPFTKPSQNPLQKSTSQSTSDWKEVPLTTQQPQTSTGEALLQGLIRGSNFGLQDEAQGVVGGAERGIKYLTGNSKDKGLMDALRTGYMVDRDAQRAYQDTLDKEHPVASFAGQIASGLPQLASKAPVSIANMVAQGALSGFGNSQGSVYDQAKDTAIGGGIAGGLGFGLNKVGSALANTAEEAKTSLGLKALGATKKQVTSLDNRAPETVQYALDQGLMNPFKNTMEQKATNVSNLQDIGSQLNTSRKNGSYLDSRDILNALANKTESYGSGSLDKPIINQINALKSDVSTLGPQVNAEDIAGLKTKIADASRNSFGDVTKNKQGMEDVRKILREFEISSATDNTPNYSELLNNYSKNKDISKMLTSKAAGDKSNSIISLGGMIGLGGLGAAAGAAGSGHSELSPYPLAVAALLSKTGRDKTAKLGAVSIDAIQKLSEKLNIPQNQLLNLFTRQSTQKDNK